MPKIFRTRYIPYETIDLSSDVVLYRDEAYLITFWQSIRPRTDISCGVSCLFIKEGWKISAFMDQNKRILYWYCDIMDIQYKSEEDTYYLKDLLTDIRMTDGRVEVVDLDELAEAFEKGLITQRQLSKSLRQADNLLKWIYREDVPARVLAMIRELTRGECPI